ncbi:MAG: hypothetical protein U7M05_12075 [Candidatus Igneacidithiobacillus chanchocoensis]
MEVLETLPENLSCDELVELASASSPPPSPQPASLTPEIEKIIERYVRKALGGLRAQKRRKRGITLSKIDILAEDCKSRLGQICRLCFYLEYEGKCCFPSFGFGCVSDISGGSEGRGCKFTECLEGLGPHPWRQYVLIGNQLLICAPCDEHKRYLTAMAKAEPGKYIGTAIDLREWAKETLRRRFVLRW